MHILRQTHKNVQAVKHPTGGPNDTFFWWGPALASPLLASPPLWPVDVDANTGPSCGCGVDAGVISRWRWGPSSPRALSSEECGSLRTSHYPCGGTLLSTLRLTAKRPFLDL